MSTRCLTYVILCAIASIGISGHASAQITPFRDNSSTRSLTPEDLKIMQAAAEELYKGPNVADGTTRTWYNGRTGNGGVVTFDGALELHGFPCRKLTYAVTLKKEQNARRYTVDWCKTADGSWKLG